MLILREYDFEWREPDPRVSDTIARLEIPQDLNYFVRKDDEFRLLIPAQGYLQNPGDALVASSDVKIINRFENSVEIKLPFLAKSKYYDIHELVSIITVPSEAEVAYTYNPETETFTMNVPEPTGEYRIYYVPSGGEIKLVHIKKGDIKVENTIATVSTNHHVTFDPARNPPKIQKDVLLESRTALEIRVYPRTINRVQQYSFNPFQPSWKLNRICSIELPVHRAYPQ